MYQEAIKIKNQLNQPEAEKTTKINKLLKAKSREFKRKDDSQQITKEKENRLAWRHGYVPAYFESEWGRKYLEERELDDRTNSSHGILFDDTKDHEKRGYLNTENNFLQMSENDFVNAVNNELNQKSEPNLSNTTNLNRSLKDEIISRTSGNYNFYYKIL